SPASPRISSRSSSGIVTVTFLVAIQETILVVLQGVLVEWRQRAAGWRAPVLPGAHPATSTRSPRRTERPRRAAVAAVAAAARGRGPGGQFAAVAGLEREDGRWAFHGVSRPHRLRQRRFPEPEGEDACRAGTEAVGEARCQPLGDPGRSHARGQPLRDGGRQAG